uniref:Uncharacterized protein n=1 Tax=Arundo donax TaxID=35708 RepID=A0A0A9EL72_ARUDO
MCGSPHEIVLLFAKMIYCLSKIYQAKERACFSLCSRIASPISLFQKST